MFARVVRYGIYAGLAVGTGAAIKSPEDYAITRIGRTAYTAVDIGRTYKSMLYSKEWDKDSPEYLQIRSQAHQISAEKLLELCKANKGAYIKVGQHIGALDYLLPNEYVSTMRILHSAAPKNSVEELYKVIKEDLKKEAKELFDDFEEEPLGTASLAQVHKAKLKDGTEVAVKVQHYFVKNNIQLDMHCMELIVNIMSRIFPDFQMQWLVDETKKNICKELNFIQEGKNAETIAEKFKNYSWLQIPKIFWDYSTERVLVMEYVKGGQINDLEYVEKHNIDRFDVCRKLGDLYSHMIFVDGFVHSDPHPGNILIRKEPHDKDVTVVLLDHGLYAELTPEFRYNYSKLWLSIIARDKTDMAFFSEKLGIRKELYGLFACMVTGRPWDTIMKGIDKTKPSTNEKSTFQNELPNLLHYVTQCLENVDRQALLVLKTNDLIRSIEYALKTHEHMVGFMIMTKCCMEAVYRHDYDGTTSTLYKYYIDFRYKLSLLILYLYGVYLGFVNKSHS